MKLMGFEPWYFTLDQYFGKVSNFFWKLKFAHLRNQNSTELKKSDLQKDLLWMKMNRKSWNKIDMNKKVQM